MKFRSLSLWRQGNWKISCPVLSVNWDTKVPREMCSWCSCGEGKKTGLTRSSTEWMVKGTGTHPEFCSLVLVGHSKVDWTPNAENCRSPVATSCLHLRISKYGEVNCCIELIVMWIWVFVGDTFLFLNLNTQHRQLCLQF